MAPKNKKAAKYGEKRAEPATKKLSKDMPGYFSLIGRLGGNKTKKKPGHFRAIALLSHLPGVRTKGATDGKQKTDPAK